MENVVLNSAQMHLLSMASRFKTQQALLDLQEQLTAFYAKKVDEEMDELWESGQWNEQKLADLRHAHYRTAYK